MTNKLTRIILLAMLLFSFASFVYASNIDCSVTPSDPSCAPTLSLSYRIGNGQIHSLPVGNTSTFVNGVWVADFTPQVFPHFLWTGGQVVANPADPFVGFSFGVINQSSSVMQFDYDVATAYGGGPYQFLQSVFGDVLVDTNFSGTSTIAPVGSNFVMNTYDTGTLLHQVDLGKGCITVNFVCQSLDDGAIGPLHYVSHASGTLEVKGSFTVTPGGQYTLTGRSLIYTPEPGTLALLGTGIVGLGGWLRRRF